MYSSKSRDTFIKVLRSALTNRSIELPEDIDGMMIELFYMAKAQEVLQLFCHGLKINHYEVPSYIKRSMMSDLYQYTQNDYTLMVVKETLNSAKIPFVTLKGSVIKYLYPERRMRSCCDVDILVREKHLDKAIKALVDVGFTTDYKRDYHDVVLFYGEVQLELHYNICENIPRIDWMLERVWDYTVPFKEFEYRERPDFFAFHQIAHMLYHFLRGGSKIKQYIDLWLLRDKTVYNEEELLSLLSKCNLADFYKVICDALDVWFNDGTPSQLTDNILAQILNNGILGREKYSDLINMAISGGKTKRILHVLFLPLREMKWHYPVLNSRPYLLPIYYVKRLIVKTLGAESQRAKSLIKVNMRKGTKNQEAIVKLLNQMGLV